ncbi:MAG: tRNA(Glu)-specific nuclease WapA [Luteibacter sp.]|uniref:RHS repeat domain-containing protein n=1 Tax=Luteibacter sp. TaxID=1886636 RepID=UPI00137E8126|nr:RHS repeat-associated core domain-containing protein [Luteibacter sp.]KAF1003078.1 MAG: tRNA(Glu)-specific nuclease WapA [Luteibacter sp.]
MHPRTFASFLFQLFLIAMASWCGLASPPAIAETVTYYYTNPQGTVLATADAAGNLLTTTDYRPYGAQALGSPAPGPGYTGHVNDPDSGLVYMQARYYDPTMGRFLGTDPKPPTAGSPLTFGRFTYANGNPIGNIDPDGRESACVMSASHCAGDPASALAATQGAGQVAVGIGKAIANGMAELDASLQRGTQESSPLEPANEAQAGGVLIGTVAVEAAKAVVTEGRSAEAGAASTEGRLTYLYQKLDAQGGHLKFGITYSPTSRYTATAMNGGKLNILASGTRPEMLKLERDLHETLPIGSEERQNFYIQKQVDKGLKPPPYEP